MPNPGGPSSPTFADTGASLDFSAYLSGLGMGLSLIVAIGAQNAFVLRQGLKGGHVFAVCLTCALSDVALIILGVTSFGRISLWLPWLDPVMRFGGAAFLAFYGFKNLMSALKSHGALDVGGANGATPLMPTLVACLVLTWLNPHVYLDTVVLLGTISTQYPRPGGAIRAGRHDLVLRLLLLARLWGGQAEADLRPAGGLADIGRRHRGDHVGACRQSGAGGIGEEHIGRPHIPPEVPAISRNCV